MAFIFIGIHKNTQSIVYLTNHEIVGNSGIEFYAAEKNTNFHPIFTHNWKKH